jgi:hypothetical protein
VRGGAHADHLQACVDLDKAKTNDLDGRPKIQHALDHAVAQGCSPATPVEHLAAPPAAASERTLVEATIAAEVDSASVGTPAPSGTSSATTQQVVTPTPPSALADRH